MILGFSSPTFGGVIPEGKQLSWLLDRCSEYGLKALEAGFSASEDSRDVGRKAKDLGVTWIGYWANDFITPEGGGKGLRNRAEQAFDTAVNGGVRTLAIFARNHDRFTHDPPLSDQLRLAAEHLRPVAEAASDRGLQLGLLPHLDYRAHELVSVMMAVDHPALKMAFDTTNPFPVCEEPVEAAKVVLPHAVAVAFKDVRIYPQRSNDVTIWGTPIGQGSVDFKTIIPMMPERLPDPDRTTVCIKLRLPNDSMEHASWIRQSLEFIKAFPEFQREGQ